MIKSITHLSVLVRDQEEALMWYTQTLGFQLRENDPIPETEDRWVTVSPPENADVQIVLQPPTWGPGGDTEQERQKHIGKGSSFVIITDNCRQDFETLRARGVNFVSPPEELPWGISAVFLDPYGMVYNLLELQGAA